MKKNILLIVGLLIVLSLLGAAALPLAAQGQSGTTLSASKTATGFWERRIDYDWTISKSVNPTSVEVKPGETGWVTYSIVVTRTVASDVETIGVRGEICVTNGGDVTTENLKLVDQVEYKNGPGQFQALVGASQTIMPAQLGPGESQCYPYEVVFAPVAGAQYRNSVQVTITNHSGHLGEEFGPNPKADFSLPGSPTLIEIDESAVVTDVPVCPAGFTCTPDDPGPWNFNDSGSIGFNTQIRNDSAACGTNHTLDNTAYLAASDGENHQASASVSIYTGDCPQQQAEWCSPGFWKNHAGTPPWPAGSQTLSYNGLGLQPPVDGDPTLLEVVSNPQTYGGPATNAVADYLSALARLNFTGERVENCTLSGPNTTANSAPKANGKKK